MTVTTALFDEITEAQMMPRLVRLGPNLYGAVFTLMKLLPARYILRRAIERGDLEPGTTVVETTSGTFGLALAMQSALLGRELVLVSDPAIDVHLHRRLRDLGATVEICREPAPVGGYQRSRLDRLAEVRAERARTFCPEQYSNPDNPRSYGVVADQLARALGQVDCVIGPVGSGGSMCGTVRGLRAATPHTRAVGVDTHHSVLFGQPDGRRSLRGLGNSLWPANLDHTVFDDVHWCTAGEAYAATRRLHGRHALYQGPTSGAAYLVAEWYARRHPGELCVVLLPDEGHRYQSTAYDDGWLAANGYALGDAPAGPVETVTADRPADAWSWLRWNRRRYDDVPGTVARTAEPVPAEAAR
ncbi:cystathionine beta-synthase [Amorphoplanes nipponensis]|uniref:Cystathionine beta-synthase n=2 Tax=Actinoplanes nipponensis TaxID=135950 RepID=A0A919JS49_9ACTN|nr:cysteine synthase family protein [Actinoplanes nipponensis]GIE54422.1 cystathionine beta-synthase [Actinoplanes nipponensis]